MSFLRPLAYVLWCVSACLALLALWIHGQGLTPHVAVWGWFAANFAAVVLCCGLVSYGGLFVDLGINHPNKKENIP